MSGWREHLLYLGGALGGCNRSIVSKWWLRWSLASAVATATPPKTVCYSKISFTRSVRVDLFPHTPAYDLFPCTVDIQAIVSTHVETTRSMICFEFFKSRGKQLLSAFVFIASWSSSNLSILYSFGDANIWRLFDCDILLIPVVWCAGNHLCVIIEGRKQNWFQYNSRKRKPSPCPNCFLYVLSDSI